MANDERAAEAYDAARPAHVTGVAAHAEAVR
jgi:hypothetical protein